MPSSDSNSHSGFAARHIGPSDDQIAAMLAVVGCPDLDSLVEAALPPAAVDRTPLALPPPLSEAGVQAELRELAGLNRVRTPLIGLGYYRCHTPAVIRRNVLENPAWYTAYTPYQPEISQGRLAALLAFQTVVADLTALPIANASLLDEPTAAAEAMALARRVSKVASPVFAVDADTHPQTLAVLRTRAEAVGIEIAEFDLAATAPSAALLAGCFGVLISLPGSSGRIWDPRALIESAHERGAVVAVACDLLASTIVTPPGELGADIAFGSAQRFGVPLWFGGPHAGFMAVRSGLERNLPGRLVGVSVDADGRTAYRLALQTREQHIRRERATSNICTAQVLLAVVSAFYAAYHGPDGLTEIARRVHGHTRALAAGLERLGVKLEHDEFFDTLTARLPGRAGDALAAARARGVELRPIDADRLGISLDETTSARTVRVVLDAFAEGIEAGGAASDAGQAGGGEAGSASADSKSPECAFDPGLRRGSSFLTHPWFTEYRSETAMMRWLRRLADADLALDRTMIPLGSCTMKLNPAAAMEPISWPEFTEIHPFQPERDTRGYTELIRRLEGWLAQVTGYAAVSVQPNAGSQGELAGLLAIRAFHRARGEANRTVCLVPASAHGTNAASAAMAGMSVSVVRCDEAGGVDVADLHRKIADIDADLAAIMITYPSTYGVYDDSLADVCRAVHDAGGQVYVDGANLNALVGLARPGEFGADVSHLNLHKTFCIPHGGGGPGVGPVAVRSHLAPYLPGHPMRPEAGPRGRGWPDGGAGPVSGAPWGSAGVLAIPYAYLRMMGPADLRRATEVAVLSANYVARRLEPHYPLLFAGRGGLVAHECILDLRAITKETGVTAEDVAKRLIDYGFHAPTMSFPVAGTLMVEPTESESQGELDRFCDAMIAIRGEITAIAEGEWPLAGSPLRNAPHPAAALTGDWDRPYSRELAVSPPGVDVATKYWPPVARIDGAYGDRNLMCSCPPVDASA